MHLYRANVVRDRFRAAAGAVDEKTLGKIMGVFEFVVKIVTDAEQDLFLSILDGCLAKASSDGLITQTAAKEIQRGFRTSLGKAIALQVEETLVASTSAGGQPAVAGAAISRGGV